MLTDTQTAPAPTAPKVSQILLNSITTVATWILRSAQRGSSIEPRRSMRSCPAAFLKSGKAIPAILVGLFLTACSVKQLQDNTVDIGSSTGSIYASQVLDNLNRLARDSNAVPSQFYLDTGKIKTQNTITPNLTIPLGNTVTRTVVSNGVSQVVAPYNALTLGAQEEWDQEWDITPAKSASTLQTLRAAYLYVLGMDKNGDFKDKTPEDKSPASGLIHKIFLGCKSTCFWVLSKAPCVQQNDERPSEWKDQTGQTWICLGRYGSIYSRLAELRETMVAKEAYDNGVLFDLVLLSLQARQEGKSQQSTHDISPRGVSVKASTEAQATRVAAAMAR